jgi:hypothetical protein
VRPWRIRSTVYAGEDVAAALLTGLAAAAVLALHLAIWGLHLS